MTRRDKINKRRLYLQNKRKKYQTGGTITFTDDHFGDTPSANPTTAASPTTSSNSVVQAPTAYFVPKLTINEPNYRNLTQGEPKIKYDEFGLPYSSITSDKARVSKDPDASKIADIHTMNYDDKYRGSQDAYAVHGITPRYGGDYQDELKQQKYKQSRF